MGVPQVTDDLRKNRVKALKTFVKDYDSGKQRCRYRIGELPYLHGIADQSFDLALCSHFLFLYSDHFDCAFHQSAIQEMLRISCEIRVFPLFTLSGEYSPFVEPVIQALRANGFTVGIKKVVYQLQRGGNEMLWARRP